MKDPEGISAASNLVFRLRKSIYSLKQASRKWFEKLVNGLIDQGMISLLIIMSTLIYTSFQYQRYGQITLFSGFGSWLLFF